MLEQTGKRLMYIFNGERTGTIIIKSNNNSNNNNNGSVERKKTTVYR